MSPGHGLVRPEVTAATSRRLLDDHLGRSYHRRRLRLWWRCSGEVEKRRDVEKRQQVEEQPAKRTRLRRADSRARVRGQ